MAARVILVLALMAFFSVDALSLSKSWQFSKGGAQQSIGGNYGGKTNPMFSQSSVSQLEAAPSKTHQSQVLEQSPVSKTSSPAQQVVEQAPAQHFEQAPTKSFASTKSAAPTKSASPSKTNWSAGSVKSPVQHFEQSSLQGTKSAAPQVQSVERAPASAVKGAPVQATKGGFAAPSQVQHYEQSPVQQQSAQFETKSVAPVNNVEQRVEQQAPIAQGPAVVEQAPISSVANSAQSPISQAPSNQMIEQSPVVQSPIVQKQ